LPIARSTPKPCGASSHAVRTRPSGGTEACDGAPARVSRGCSYYSCGLTQPLP
jgi:hypothetical protein